MAIAGGYQSRAASQCDATALSQGSRQLTQQHRDFNGQTVPSTEMAVAGPSSHRRTLPNGSLAVPPVDVQYQNRQQQPTESVINRPNQSNNFKL